MSLRHSLLRTKKQPTANNNKNNSTTTIPTPCQQLALSIPEVLEHILSFLTLKNRQEIARFVCKQWYAACNHLVFTTHPNLFHSFYCFPPLSFIFPFCICIRSSFTLHLLLSLPSRTSHLLTPLFSTILSFSNKQAYTSVYYPSSHPIHYIDIPSPPNHLSSSFAQTTPRYFLSSFFSNYLVCNPPLSIGERMTIYPRLSLPHSSRSPFYHFV